jgi:FkbM family methyltransferase
VWAFEPNPENHRCAQITVLLNGLDNVELHHAGLGSRAGSARLAVVDAAGTALGGASRFREHDTPDDGGEEVAIDTIDHAVPADRDVAVIQLDVEGFERTALEGAAATIARCRPVLVVERRLEPAWVEEHLAPLGYAVVGRSNANSVLRADG